MAARGRLGPEHAADGRNGHGGHAAAEAGEPPRALDAVGRAAVL
jgi:hypothetical protein